jgi:hypothetical protein
MSKIEVNQISSQCGSTLTVGQSGDTVTLAAGATQSGFGRTGTVDWDTTPKTATFSAVSGNGYFCNTTSSAFTVNLPAGVAGAIVSLADYAATWQTNNLTVSPNGTDKIGSVNADVSLTTEGQSVTFVYVDSTQGWINTMDSTSNVRGKTFIVATGGTITECGNCKIHTFTGPGTFCVSGLACVPANNEVSYMVVAGGGGGGGRHGGGGGAGGFREDKSPVTPYTASPLEGAGPITVTATAFPITVGGGGTAGRFSPTPYTAGGQGNNSVFSTITSTGGGGGGTAVGVPCGASNLAGGSGGGGTHCGPSTVAGNGNTPPVSPAQGTNGGAGMPATPYNGGGGGGATVAGTSGASGGCGGNGATTSVSGSSVTYAGGGGGGKYAEPENSPSPGGTGGGGPGAISGVGPSFIGTAGTDNTGGGGGGTGNMQEGNPSTTSPQIGSTGGSGIVIIRYKFQ